MMKEYPPLPNSDNDDSITTLLSLHSDHKILLTSEAL
jgi:hypothetical protein